MTDATQGRPPATEQLCEDPQELNSDIAMTNPQILAAKLRVAVRAGGGLDIVARRANVGRRSLANYVAGKAEPKALVLVRLARACNIPVEGLLSPDQDFQPLFEIPRVFQDAFVTSGVRPDIRLTATRTWLLRLRVRPENAALFDASGDGMFPTIKDGDLMLLDRSPNAPVDGSIYVIEVPGRQLVKRVQGMADGGITLMADNPLYPPEVVPKNALKRLAFIGRVAWIGRCT